jgi:hypothetical protein
MKRHSQQRNETSWQEVLAKLRREFEARTDEGRTADAAAATAQAILDRDLFHYDLAYRLQARVCVAPQRCDRHGCRRLGRCRGLLKIARLRAACLARAASQAGAAAVPSADGQAKTQTNH